jgi:YD repeat-containing protein
MKRQGSCTTPVATADRHRAAAGSTTTFTYDSYGLVQTTTGPDNYTGDDVDVGP